MSHAPTVVLVHGLAIRHRAAAMFTGVAETLRRDGHAVAQPVVQGDGTLETLAARLGDALVAVPGPLVLLCHSMGGLWARRLMLEPGIAARLRAVATVGTPHRGSPLALGAMVVQRACRDLAPHACARRARLEADAEDRACARHGIARLSVVARRTSAHTHASMAAGAVLLRLAGCDGGDGLVPAASQAWGEVLFEADLDHLECACEPGCAPPAAVDLWRRLAREAVRGRPAAALPGT